MQHTHDIVVLGSGIAGSIAALVLKQIGLSTLVGLIGVAGSGAIGGHFSFWRGGLGVDGPIFTGGRLESQYRNRKAYWDETVASYKQTILLAFREDSPAGRNAAADGSALNAVPKKLMPIGAP